MIAYQLYLELLFVGSILLAILFFNNIFLYKQKITDRISLMLIFGLAMSIFEIIWTFGEANPSPRLRVIDLIAACGYCNSFIIFVAILNRYLIDRFGIRPSKKWIAIGYVIPVTAFILLCITTQWTRLLLWVDEGGVLHPGVLFYSLFYIMVLGYFFSPLFVAIAFLIMRRNKKSSELKISVSLCVYGIMAPAIYYLQIWLLGDPLSAFQTMSLPCSIALVYLVTNVSTHTVLDTRAKVEAVETEMRIAAKIQTDAMPEVAPEFTEYPELNLRGCMSTAKEVGGDFYDYFPVDDHRICFLIADVSGKGTPAALFMMTAKTMIRDYAMTSESTSEIFNAVNVRLCDNNKVGMFATAWIGIVDTRTMKLQYTNAGHNYPVFIRPGKQCEILKELHGLFLAGMEFTRYKQGELQLEPGDRLLLYTDGVTEAHDAAGKFYGLERLEKVLENNRDLPGEQVLERVLNDINGFAMGVSQYDDITMVVMTVKN